MARFILFNLRLVQEFNEDDFDTRTKFCEHLVSNLFWTHHLWLDTKKSYTGSLKNQCMSRNVWQVPSWSFCIQCCTLNDNNYLKLLKLDTVAFQHVGAPPQYFFAVRQIWINYFEDFVLADEFPLNGHPDILIYNP